MTKYTILLICLPFWLISQVNINGGVHISTHGDTLNKHAILGLYSDTSTIALPNLTTVERDAFGSPQQGMLIYNIDDRKYQGYQISDPIASSTLDCCSNGGNNITRQLTNTTGIQIEIPEDGKIESINLSIFYLGATDSISIAISSTPQSNCINGNEGILSLTDKVEVINGWNVFIPIESIYVKADDIIHIWSPDVNNNNIDIRTSSNTNNPDITLYQHSSCTPDNSEDPWVQLIQTKEGWVDLH